MCTPQPGPRAGPARAAPGGRAPGVCDLLQPGAAPPQPGLGDAGPGRPDPAGPADRTRADRRPARARRAAPRVRARGVARTDFLRLTAHHGSASLSRSGLLMTDPW